MPEDRSSFEELVTGCQQVDRQYSEVTLDCSQLIVNAEGLLYPGGDLRLDQCARGRIFEKVGAPPWYWQKHTPTFQAYAITEHLTRGDVGHRPKLIVRNGRFVAIASGKLISLGFGEVLSSIREALGREAEQLIVTKIEHMEDRLEVELVSTSKAISVRAGDIVQAGLHIVHAPYGNDATVIATFNHRLVCSNGAIRRECIARDGIVRTRKMPTDHPQGRELQLDQVRRLTQQVWKGLQPQLEALRATSQRRANVGELLNNWLLRARISRRGMMPRLLAAWELEGSENTHYGAVNALTRVATHDPHLSRRQRRTLSMLGGMLAFSQVHLCPKCYSMLTGRHEDLSEHDSDVIDTTASAAGERADCEEQGEVAL
jgi:hypothetical protein